MSEPQQPCTEPTISIKLILDGLVGQDKPRSTVVPASIVNSIPFLQTKVSFEQM